MYCATEYPDDRADSAAAAKVAAKKDTNTMASPARPNATATGTATWFRWLTWMPAGCSTGTAAAMMARLSSPPSGNPMKALTRISVMLVLVQPSSRPPEEKKITW